MEEEEILAALYNGLDIYKLPITEEMRHKYNQSEWFEEPLEEPIYTEKFLMPEEYHELSYDDIRSKCLEKCNAPEEISRMDEELEIFHSLDKMDMIKYFIYLVDHMKQNNIVWGIGRGSSVSIFLFYLIGIHKVNSVKHKLEYTDFFKIQGE